MMFVCAGLRPTVNWGTTLERCRTASRPSASTQTTAKPTEGWGKRPQNTAAFSIKRFYSIFSPEISRVLQTDLLSWNFEAAVNLLSSSSRQRKKLLTQSFTASVSEDTEGKSFIYNELSPDVLVSVFQLGSGQPQQTHRSSRLL